VTAPQTRRIEDDPETTDPRGPLLRKWQESDDREALDALLRLEISALKDQIRMRGKSLLGTSLTATDVAHEAVLRLLSLESTPRFEEPEKLSGYLWTTAWRLLLQRLRKPARTVGRMDMQDTAVTDASWFAAPGTDDNPSNEEVAVEVAMNLLGEEDRAALQMVYWDEVERTSAAEKMGMTPDAFNMRLVRARRKLARKLEEWTRLVGV
jgi:RNA polymerase sigma factor (sigma-70 family)